MAHDTVIRGGTVVDGTGAPGRPADVAIDGDRIVEIGPGLDGRRVLDAAARSWPPGSSTSTPTTTPRCSGTRR